jgi:diguanylate cyclase (GGDEF)-like protein
MQTLTDTTETYFSEFKTRWRDPANRGWFLVALAVATFAVIGWVDHLLPPEISVTGVYLIPVAVIAWYLGRFAGHVSVAVAVVWKLAADILAVQPTAAFTIAWGILVLILLAVSGAEVLTLLHRALNAEHDLARTDSLTGIPNARAFRESALAELERVKRYGGVFTLASLDLDHFKDVNDAEGHLVGDRLLRDVGQALANRLRKVDVVARVGGDEFAMLMPHTGEWESSVALRHAREALDELTPRYGDRVRASIGSVTFSTPPASLDEMVRLADAALYRAKAEGRDRVTSLLVPRDLAMLEE